MNPVVIYRFRTTEHGLICVPTLPGEVRFKRLCTHFYTPYVCCSVGGLGSQSPTRDWDLLSGLVSQSRVPDLQDSVSVSSFPRSRSRKTGLGSRNWKVSVLVLGVLVSVSVSTSEVSTTTLVCWIAYICTCPKFRNLIRELNTMARILESGLTLVHPYSKNKSDKEDCLFLFLLLIFREIIVK